MIAVQNQNGHKHVDDITLSHSSDPDVPHLPAIQTRGAGPSPSNSLGEVFVPIRSDWRYKIRQGIYSPWGLDGGCVQDSTRLFSREGRGRVGPPTKHKLCLLAFQLQNSSCCEIFVSKSIFHCVVKYIHPLAVKRQLLRNLRLICSLLDDKILKRMTVATFLPLHLVNLSMMHLKNLSKISSKPSVHCEWQRVLNDDLHQTPFCQA